MGQRASKSLATRVQRASNKIIEQAEAAAAIQQQQQDQQVRVGGKAPLEPSNTTQAIQNAMDPRTGFMRGQGPMEDPRDTIQRQYLQQREQAAAPSFRQDHSNTAQNEESVPEMPKELIQFLNDIGPLDRQIDEGMTSPRLRRSRTSQDTSEGDTELLPQPPNDGRVVRELPIMDHTPDFTTTRTTNFSKDKDDDETKDGDAQNKAFRLSDLELYRLLGGKATENEFIAAHGSTMEDGEAEKNLKLLQNTQRYLELPLICKDADNVYFGVSPSSPSFKSMVDNPKDDDNFTSAMIKIKPVSKDKVRLVLEAFDQREKPEQ